MPESKERSELLSKLAPKPAPTAPATPTPATPTPTTIVPVPSVSETPSSTQPTADGPETPKQADATVGDSDQTGAGSAALENSLNVSAVTVVSPHGSPLSTSRTSVSTSTPLQPTPSTSSLSLHNETSRLSPARSPSTSPAPLR